MIQVKQCRNFCITRVVEFTFSPLKWVKKKTNFFSVFLIGWYSKSFKDSFLEKSAIEWKLHFIEFEVSSTLVDPWHGLTVVSTLCSRFTAGGGCRRSFLCSLAISIFSGGV